MKQVFLGPLVHWLVLAGACIAGWFAGEARLHVTHFNLFVILVIAGTVAGLLIVLFTARPGTRITRDPIEDVADPVPGDPAQDATG